jgi:hypothetical protein
MYTATYNVVFPKWWSSLHPHAHTVSTAICLFKQCCLKVPTTEHVPTAQHSNCCVFKTDTEQGSWVSVVSERQWLDHRQRQRTFPQVLSQNCLLKDLPPQHERDTAWSYCNFVESMTFLLKTLMTLRHMKICLLKSNKAHKVYSTSNLVMPCKQRHIAHIQCNPMLRDC